MREFHRDPEIFARRFGMTGLRGIFAWAVLALPLGIVIYAIVRPLVSKVAQKYGASE